VSDRHPKKIEATHHSHYRFFSADSSSISVWGFERIVRELSAGTDLVLFQTGPNRD
jgi:hypothetical protein